MKSKTSILHEINEPGDIRKYLTKNIKTYKNHSILFRQDNEPLGIYFIMNGSVKISKIYKKEKERTLKVANEGDIFGIEAFIKGIPHSASATVLGDSIICFISINELNTIIKEYSSIFFELLVKLFQYILIAEERIFVVSIKTIEEKLLEIFSEQKMKMPQELNIFSNIQKIINKETSNKSIIQSKKANYFQLKIKQLIC